jgi:hypothetical protein
VVSHPARPRYSPCRYVSRHRSLFIWCNRLTNPPPKIELDLNCLLISLASTEAIDSAASTSGGDSGEDTPFGGDALAGESVGDTFNTGFDPSGGDSGEDTPSTGSAPSSGESGGDTPSTGSTPKTTDTEPTPPPDTHQDSGVLPKSVDPAPDPGSSSSGGGGVGGSGMAPHETPAGVGDGTKPAGAPPPTGRQTPPGGHINGRSASSYLSKLRGRVAPSNHRAAEKASSRKQEGARGQTKRGRV